jgi:uncharacterized membrane-anchored protein YhcB (DUF1043 family)
MRNMNTKTTLLLLGLVVGGIIGYLTRPESSEIRIGPMNIQITGPGPAQGGPLTSDQMQHIMLIAVLGAVVGFGLGLVAERGGFRT